ncbi:endonuclease/exonuclease/phosphatase family protein [Embleya sp. AB8]|uniref:endonuclease/exonuclease/phosphatase family protein n=1 Tax=Embleya sp. AB8 TaxID=3156304 RepID=UPI003C7844E4
MLTFNLNNPSLVRARQQVAYLAARPEQVLVLTETADSVGCNHLAERFTAAGYEVAFPRPGWRERGVMVVSRLAMRPASFWVDYLPHRAVAVTVDTDRGPLDVIGLYVPSRDATPEKTERKRRFLEEISTALPSGAVGARVVIGDLNVLERNHVPRYKVLRPFEYEFYDGLAEAGYRDAYRELHATAREYSWVGRTGDGYRYDHAHVSKLLLDTLSGCAYDHEPRTGAYRLTDHSSLSISLAVAATAPLSVGDPTIEPERTLA